MAIPRRIGTAPLLPPSDREDGILSPLHEPPPDGEARAEAALLARLDAHDPGAG